MEGTMIKTSWSHMLLFFPSTPSLSQSRIKFVNAILRRVERERQDLQSLTTPTDNIAPWLKEEWRETWGDQKLAAITDASMEESPVYLWVKQELGSSPEQKLQTLQSTQLAFQEEAGLDAKISNDSPVDILPHGSIYIDKSYFPGLVSKWPLYNEGQWWVQDAAATLPALALYNAIRSKENKTDQQRNSSIVDLCAAPGGKTAQLLSLGFPSVIAVEASPRRAKQLHVNMNRLGLKDRCTIVVADGSQWTPEQGRESVAGILLDVPCSATGTGSRRPDVLRKDKQQLTELLETQYSLAKHCLDNLLEPGGIMVYATCSLLRQESEDQVQKLLDRTDGAPVETLPFRKGEIPGFDEAIDERGNLRVIPGLLPGKLSHCDGFFVARLQKKG
jgi:16S rRNA (cytosine967-C5)-methyltransferase